MHIRSGCYPDIGAGDNLQINMAKLIVNILENSGGVLVWGAGTLEILDQLNNSGYVNLQTGNDPQNGGNLINNGKIKNDGTILNDNIFQNSGTIYISNTELAEMKIYSKGSIDNLSGGHINNDGKFHIQAQNHHSFALFHNQEYT